VRHVLAAGLEISLLVGTASTSEDLGYAVPAGQWTMNLPLMLKAGTELDTESDLCPSR
jgi:hypothetical protein